MFPIPWNFPFRKKNGDMSTIGDVIGGAGSELPPHSGSDAGKLLGVGSDGKLGWTDDVSSEIQTLTKYANSQSNPNLLDNPWFTVNQRGFTSDSNPDAGTHITDRWAVRYNPSNGAVDVNDAIVTLTSTGELLIIAERFEESVALSGKRVTASIMMSNGTIYSNSAVFPSKNDADVHVIDTDDFTVYFQYSSYSENYPMLGITCKANKTLAIKAVKLELGEVSTLAMDTAPNYAEELLKCQRYFVRLGSSESVTAYKYNLGMAYENSDNAYYNVLLASPMRITPTVTYQGSWAIGSKLLNNISVNSMFNNLVKLVCTTSESLTPGKIELFENKESGINFIDLSADL